MSISPFDEALNKPFIDERPPTKKWSIMGGSSCATKEEVDLEEGPMEDVDIEACPLIEMEEVLFDDALVAERHNELFGINKDLQQINTIHQDLAGLVDAQDDDIKRMSWFAIETFENTESGLEQIVRAAKYSDNYQRAQRRKHLLFMLLGLVVVLGFSRALMVDDAEANADYDHSDAKLHLPIIHIHLP